MTTFSYTGKFASYTVESTGVYDIVAFGAQGGGSYGEKGAEIGGDVTLTAGEKLTIAVGGAGQELSGGCASFVVVPGGTPTPLIIAGGGGESVEASHYTSYPAAGQTGTLGTGLDVGKPGYDYGINGNSSYKSFNTEAGGGGGFLTSGGGTNGTRGASYMAGLAGGADGGGFGGGGGNDGFGGGGGYSGGFGGGDAGASQANFPGGGGGSLDKGTN